jgi:hypothetical protein
MIIEPTEYKTADTKSKQRIHGGKFGNALGQIPWISFDEEFVTYDSVADKIYTNPAGSCQCSLTDPLKTLTLRNPLDDSIIGESTYQDVFVLLYSLGRQTQIERDAEMIAAMAAPV